MMKQTDLLLLVLTIKSGLRRACFQTPVLFFPANNTVCRPPSVDLGTPNRKP